MEISDAGLYTPLTDAQNIVLYVEDLKLQLVKETEINANLLLQLTLSDGIIKSNEEFIQLKGDEILKLNGLVGTVTEEATVVKGQLEKCEEYTASVERRGFWEKVKYYSIGGGVGFLLGVIFKTALVL